MNQEKCLQLKIKKLCPNVELPKYKKPGDSGMDLHAFSEDEIEWLVPARSTVIIKTGLSMEIPEGYEIQIRSRSGLASKNGLIVVNSPGTIDSGYRGEIGVALHNLLDKDQFIHHGDRIAQAVLAPVMKADIVEVEDLSSSERGEGGFGSTGNK